ncbi:MAG: hypothetical protein AAF368_17380, partial [Planctomycetota bacterium]
MGRVRFLMRALSSCFLVLFLSALALGGRASTAQDPLEPPPESEQRRVVPKPTESASSRLEKARLLAEKQARITRLACNYGFRTTREPTQSRPPHPKVERTGPPPPGRVEIEVHSLQRLERTEPWTLTLYRVGDLGPAPRRLSLWAFEQRSAGHRFYRKLTELEPGSYEVCLEPLGIWRAVSIGARGSSHVLFELPWLARVRVEPVDNAGLSLHAPRIGALEVARVDGAWKSLAKGDSRLVNRLGQES